MENVIDRSDLEAWIFTLGSVPEKLVLFKDYAGGYKVRRARVLKLENGKYALVTENGCSCYSASQAVIDLFPNLCKAKDYFDKWCKENRREGEV